MLRRAVSAAAGAASSVQICRFLARERSDEHSFGTAVEQFVMFDALRVAGAGMRYMHDRDCAAFERTQRTLLRDLLRQNAETAYVAGTTALVAVPGISNARLWDYDDEGGCVGPGCSVQ